MMDWNGVEPVFVGIAKLDLEAPDKQTAIVKTVSYGEGVVGGEAFFVPSHTIPAECDGKATYLCVAFSRPV